MGCAPRFPLPPVILDSHCSLRRIAHTPHAVTAAGIASCQASCLALNATPASSLPQSLPLSGLAHYSDSHLETRGRDLSYAGALPWRHGLALAGWEDGKGRACGAYMRACPARVHGLDGSQVLPDGLTPGLAACITSLWDTTARLPPGCRVPYCCRCGAATWLQRTRCRAA